MKRFWEICLNPVFSILVMKSVVCCINCDSDEFIIGVFSRGSLVKEAPATRGKVSLRSGFQSWWYPRGDMNFQRGAGSKLLDGGVEIMNGAFEQLQ